MRRRRLSFDSLVVGIAVAMMALSVAFIFHAGLTRNVQGYVSETMIVR